LALRWEPSSAWSTHLRLVRYGEVTASATDTSGWSQARIDALAGGYQVAFEPAVPSISATGAPVPTTQRQVLQTFGAKWVTDLEVTYRMGRRLTVSVGANNLLDVYPETNIRTNAAFLGSDNAGIFPYNGISPFGFNGTFYYTTVAHRFCAESRRAGGFP
ncbi:MAG: hypothetical protein ACKOUK_00465, partial [Verrucomicrobiota bacterium]